MPACRAARVYDKRADSPKCLADGGDHGVNSELGFDVDRQRFPAPAALQALAGTCPVTQQSGKTRQVRFRTACDHEFRHIVQQWARETLSQSAWAAAYLQRVRPHCHSDSHATRCLANRWLAVAWKLWQVRQPYDEAYHTQQRLARSQPRR